MKSTIVMLHVVLFQTAAIIIEYINFDIVVNKLFFSVI